MKGQVASTSKIKNLQKPQYGKEFIQSEQEAFRLAAYILPKQRHRQQNPKDPSIIKPYNPLTSLLDHETLNLVLNGSDLAHKVTSLVGSDAGRDHRARHTSGPTQGELAGDVDVGDVLVLSEEGQVKQDGQGGGVRGQDDDLGGSAIEGLGGCFVC